MPSNLKLATCTGVSQLDLTHGVFFPFACPQGTHQEGVVLVTRGAQRDPGLGSREADCNAQHASVPGGGTRPFPCTLTAHDGREVSTPAQMSAPARQMISTPGQVCPQQHPKHEGRIHWLGFWGKASICTAFFLEMSKPCRPVRPIHVFFGVTESHCFCPAAMFSTAGPQFVRRSSMKDGTSQVILFDSLPEFLDFELVRIIVIVCYLF